MMPQRRPNFWVRSYMRDIVIRQNFVVRCMNWSTECIAVKLKHEIVLEWMSWCGHLIQQGKKDADSFACINCYLMRFNIRVV